MKAEEFFHAILQKNGPDQNEYLTLDDLCANHSEVLLKIDKKKVNFLKSSESVMGHMLNKPYGYAGDFKIIDRLYTKEKSKNFSKWDDYTLNNSAAIAVRNRKEYFKAILREKIKSKEDFKVLSIATGPARCIAEFFDEFGQDIPNIKITLLDTDPHAIAYAKKLNYKNVENIEFVNKNVLKFDTDEKFDLIWSPGVFDYFDDKTFIYMLKKIQGWLRPDGEVILGNFNSEHNPSKWFMEIFGEWILHHRNDDKLRSLAVMSGFLEENTTIGREDENVNLFLHIEN